MESSKNITIILLFVNLSAIGITSGYLIWNYQSSLIDEILDFKQLETVEKAKALQDWIDVKSSRIQLLANLPAIESTLKFINYNTSNISFEKDEIINLFEDEIKEIVAIDPNITQLTIVNDIGQEIVKIDSHNKQATVLRESELQNQDHTDVFKQTMILNKSINVSSIQLKVKNNEIITPHTSVVTLSTPVIQSDGEKLGILIIEYDIGNILVGMLPTDNGNISIINQDGEIIHHREKIKQFGKILGTGYNYFNEQPELRDNMRNFDTKFHHDREESEFRLWHKVFHSEDRTKYWVIVSAITEDELYEPVKDITINLSYIWFALVGLTIGITLTLSRYITKRERKLLQDFRKSFR